MTALETYLRDQKEYGVNGDWHYVFGLVRWGYWLDDSTFIEYRYSGKCALIRWMLCVGYRDMLTMAWQMDVVSCEAYKHDRLDAIRKMSRLNEV